MTNEKNRAYFYAVGRRKTARATVRLFPDGHGEITINGVKLREWSDDDSMLENVLKPLEIVGAKKDFDLEILSSGGGKKAQSESMRLGISRALVKKEASLRTQLKGAGLLTRDPRVKERKKPGLKGARRAPQFSKR